MNRHGTDAVSLAFGAVFLTAVAWWLLIRSIDLELPSFGWFVAGGLIVLGLLGVGAAARPGHDSRAPR